jgi:hypothetical protein
MSQLDSHFQSLIFPKGTAKLPAVKAPAAMRDIPVSRVKIIGLK